MSEIGNSHARPTDPVGRVLYSITRAFALFGGFVICAMAVLTTVSVIGRAFFNAPVSGDFELIAIGTGVGVFAFLPYCQLIRENVVGDVFLSMLPFRVNAVVGGLGSLVYGLIIALMAWRTSLGGIDLYNVEETTLILAIPRWWTFPLAIVCLVLLGVVCAYTLVRSVRETRLDRPI